MPVDFVLMDCSECGCQSALSAAFVARRQRDGKTFHCPNGHRQWFGPGAAELLQQKLDAANARLRAAEEEVRQLREKEAARKAKRRKTAKGAK